MSDDFNTYDNNEMEVIPVRPEKEKIERISGTNELLAQIRPEWQSKSLIERVNKILPVDPSSACQRLFNAAIQDLRQKILVAGIDIAKEAAERNKLPPISQPEDIIESYPVAKIIDLAYRMGILTRPEWRRISRSYEIRRDLEHEDDQYEADIEDVFYIFKTCIEVILSKDPRPLLHTKDVEQLIETPEPASPSAEFLIEYEMAPETRQQRILELLVNTTLNSKKADIIRQNAIEALRSFSPKTKTQVKVQIGQMLQERVGRGKLELIIAKVAYAAGVLPYLKQRQSNEFFDWIGTRFEQIHYHWKLHESHKDLFDDLEDVGGLVNCPPEIRRKLVSWMTLCFLGEEGGYGEGRNRSVFYSNVAAPRIRNMFSKAQNIIGEDFVATQQDNKVKNAITNKQIARRLEMLRDIVSGVSEE